MFEIASDLVNGAATIALAIVTLKFAIADDLNAIVFDLCLMAVSVGIFMIGLFDLIQFFAILS